MAEWAAAHDPWEGFDSAHTWIYAEQSWWHLAPRPIGAPAQAGSGSSPGLGSPCHVITAYNPGGRAATDADNRAAARALRADPRLHGLVLLPSFGGHPDGAWLEPGVAIIGLSRHQAQVLGRAYGQLALYELDATTRRVVACDSDHVVSQAVVCHRGQEPPAPLPSQPS
jgi:uncharacterized protein DUF3293